MPEHLRMRALNSSDYDAGKDYSEDALSLNDAFSGARLHSVGHEQLCGALTPYG